MANADLYMNGFCQLQNLFMSPLYLCPDCDLLLRSVPHPLGYRICCPRCFKILEHCRGCLQTARALVLSALLFYIPANLCPVVSIELSSVDRSFVIFEGVVALWHGHMYAIAVMVLLFSIVIPLVRLLTMGIVLLPVRLLRHHGLAVMRFGHLLHGWGMLNIYLLGVLVSIFKLKDYSNITIEPGFWFIGLVMICELRCSQRLPRERLWHCYSHYRRVWLRRERVS